MLCLWAQEAKRFRPIMVARCRLKLGDVGSYATGFGLWIFELRSTETLSQMGPNGLYHTLSRLVCGAVETQTIVPRSMNRVIPDIGINDNTSRISERNPDVHCEVKCIVNKISEPAKFLGIASASGFSRQPDLAIQDRQGSYYLISIESLGYL